MALTSYLMKELLERVRPGMRIASMGYPDIIITPDEVSEITGNVKLKYLDKSVSLWHGKDYLLPEAKDFFKSLDIELDVYDVAKTRGCEIICDLNQPYHSNEEYDAVIDVGTLEHCFNIGQALFNMAFFVKQHGFIIHENPLNWGNHGFYGLNPTLYNDFYEENGFKLESCVAIESQSRKVHEVPRTQRFIVNGGECNLIAIARRYTMQDFKFPVQTKYKKFIKE